MIQRLEPADVTVRGVRLRAARVDPPGLARNVSVIVFLHEALGSIEQWKGFPRALCEAMGCRGLVYERRGHGGSDPLIEPRRMDFYLEESDTLFELLAEYGIEHPILFGHSDGGTIALAFAARYPDCPSAVIAEAAHVIVEDITVEGIRNAALMYRCSDLRKKLSRYHGGNTDAVFSAWTDTWLHPEARDWNMLQELHAVRAPVFAIQGEDDAYGSMEQLRKIVANCSGPVSALPLPACGHVPHLEARDAVILACLDFCRASGLILSGSGQSPS